MPKSVASASDGPPYAATEDELAPSPVEDRRWGWIEIFVAIQLLWGVLLFVPGDSAVPRVRSRAARTWPASRRSPTTFARRPANGCPRAAQWLIAVVRAAVAEPAARGDAPDGRGRADGLSARHRRADVLGRRGRSAPRRGCAAGLLVIFCGQLRQRGGRRPAGVLSPIGFCRPEFSALARQLNPAYRRRRSPTWAPTGG